MAEGDVYDFYFSLKHAIHLDSLDSAKTRCEVWTKGWERYTEAIKHGCEPASKHFGDLVLIATMPWDYRLIRVIDLRRRRKNGFN